MFSVQRIYDYTPQADSTGVFLDRLYPRGVHKELMAQVVWLKDLTPSAELRRWYHADSSNRYAEFAARYRAELLDPVHQAALAELWRLSQARPHTVLLIAVKQPEHSHIAVLLDYLHENGEHGSVQNQN